MNRPNVNLPSPNTVTNTSYNEANQMLTFDGKNMIYDENGNLVSVTNSCGTTTYTWDARNRLVGINGYKSNCSLLNASFKYDALGRRIEKTINGRTIQYLYDGVDIVQEIENGVPSVNYIRTLNIDEPLVRITTSALRFYQTDALGSVIALTDETGTVRTTYTYDPFGNVTISGESSDNPFQYTGRENDGTGLYYYRARYYSPELQRFISEDPIGLEGGINLYAYVGNNPVNFVDPLGLEMLLLGRQPFIFRYPGVNRLAPKQRFTPRSFPKETPARQCKPVQQPTPSPTPEPSWWGRLLKDLADWLDELGGGAGPTLPYDPYSDLVT